MLFCCQALRLHVSKLVYNRLFRDSRQLQNVRLYNYHDGVKMHSRRVCFRSRAFYRLAWCPDPLPLVVSDLCKLGM